MMQFGDKLSSLLGQSLFSEPESLPLASDISVWLFEHPVRVALVFGLFAAVLAYKAIQRAAKRLWILTVVLASFGVGGFILGHLITTDREILRTNSRVFIQSAVDSNPSTARDILSQEVSLLFGPTRVEDVGKEQLLTAIPLVRLIGLTGATVKKLQAVIDGKNVGRTQVQVRVSIEGSPSLTWWHMDWRKESDGQWRVFRLRCLLINGREPSPALYQSLR